jgi:hypothetical protein
VGDVTYTYAKDPVDGGRLQAEAAAAGLPVLHVNTSPGTVHVVMTRDLTAPEVTTLDGVVAAHDGRPRRPRVLYNIYQDVNALTGAQKTNIGADLFGGSPPRVSTDTGPNAPDLLIIWTMRQLTSLAVADKRLLETDAISIYVLDNPTYLVHPSFDPSINLPGDEPYTPV